MLVGYLGRLFRDPWAETGRMLLGRMLLNRLDLSSAKLMAKRKGKVWLLVWSSHSLIFPGQTVF